MDSYTIAFGVVMLVAGLLFLVGVLRASWNYWIDVRELRRLGRIEEEEID